MRLSWNEVRARAADFALLTSTMHMAWMRAVTGRLENRYQYSVGVVYNTFSSPTGFPEGKADLSKLEPPAQAVLDARDAHPGATLADFYDPELMPPALRRTHKALDRAMDKLYRRTPFATERERVKVRLSEHRESPGCANIVPPPSRSSGGELRMPRD